MTRMADLSQRFSDNAVGAYYVDENCIACDTCVGIAPKHFKLTDHFDHAVVITQPLNQSEIALVNEALACCPVNAIGNDGDPT